MIIYLADLPKPIHGMSNVNFHFLKEIKLCTEELKVIDTAPNFLSNTFPSKIYTLSKLIYFFSCVFKLFKELIFSKKTKTLYRPINAGYGQIYDIIFIIIARIFKVKIFIHHHSFFYLNRKRFLTKTLIKLASERAKHIVLGPKMRDLLQEKYSLNQEIFILSNVFINKEYLPSKKYKSSDFIVLGHLANLTAEKGVLRFIEIVKFLNRIGLKVIGEIAGPIHDNSVNQIIQNETTKNKFINYHGPVYGDDKEKFLERLDIFLFPTSYINEAEPLVLYEAAKFGCLLVGSTVGCMKEVINSLGGECTDPNNFSNEHIGNLINISVRKGSLSNESRCKRVSKYNHFKKDNYSRLTKLQKRMINL